MAVSCSSSGIPAYVLTAGENNELVESYKAYFELDGKSVKEVREDRYNNLVLRSDGAYNLIEQTTYSFTAEAGSTNADKWIITESSSDKETYDMKKLVKYLKKMQVYYTGDLSIQVSAFDSYTVIEVRKNDGNTVTDVKTALFKNSSLVKLPDGLTLKSLKKVYKKA